MTPQLDRVQSTVDALRAELVNVVNGLVGEGFPLQDPQVRDLPQQGDLCNLARARVLQTMFKCTSVVHISVPPSVLIHLHVQGVDNATSMTLCGSPVLTLPAALVTQGWLGRLEAMNEASSICACLKDLEVSY